MNRKKFAFYGFLVGILYAAASIAPFLLCKLTGIGMVKDWTGRDCNPSFFYRPFVEFYYRLSEINHYRYKGLFFVDSNLVFVGEALLIVAFFVLIGFALGFVLDMVKGKNKL